MYQSDNIAFGIRWREEVQIARMKSWENSRKNNIYVSYVHDYIQSKLSLRPLL